MAKKTTLTTELKQEQRLSTILQRELGRVLEKNANEMLDEVKRELDENPALDQKNAEEDLNTTTEDGRRSETSEQLQRNDYGDEDDVMPTQRYRAGNRSADDMSYVPEVVNEITLAEYLLQQVAERDLSDHDREIAKNIIGNLDNNGYLQRSTRAIADDITFNESIETETYQVEHVLDIVRQFDPPGIAAKDLRECLILQLKDKPGTDAELARRILSDYFDDFTHKRFDTICSQLKIDKTTLDRIINREIRTLNPKPGSAYTGGPTEEHTNQITPDFTVEVNGDSLSLSLNNNIPELCITESYERSVKEFQNNPPVTRERKDNRQIVMKAYNRTQNYIRVLKMRQETLFKCMNAIIHRQKEYFFTGDLADLRPMTLQNIATDIGMDVSVISRATTNKYVDTQWGIKPLKFFFSEGIDGISTREIKDALKQIVDSEDKLHPYSDNTLCELLNKQGYNIARRTIGKYRESQGIPKASLRKIVN
ncbi:MAG: RNA polymerase factor sigma-54 [Muribaculaceae bacterium]|nr:RNA polymerase factor sigma-54 [Muribaculaceae bacterium]